jgi:hypothetical protein
MGRALMSVMPTPLSPVTVSTIRCPDRVEVHPDDPVVSAVVVKAWIAHLRSHGWTDKDLGLIWLSRGRQGVTR